MQKEKSKTPKAPGFFKTKLMEYKAKRLLKWSKELGLSLVKIEKRGNAHYIVAQNGQYMKIGSGGK